MTEEQPKQTRLYTLDDLKKNNHDKSCYLLIHGKVYNVTDFLEEHPGGYDIILGSTGKDATQDFEEIGHSNSAKELLAKYLIGDYEQVVKLASRSLFGVAGTGTHMHARHANQTSRSMKLNSWIC
ncbi:cytochrome b-5, isoform CRA_e [Dunaliella salina]|uniref:Cytochrome b-5, isoform CRA_e n=1 Tax=Dunaliella salina TaxID=3046 RepID=A0ABQ7G562_DUNSA|nr:cytochrome b-5, isoform CRA_e [Dunaliella salina]|eukprot:KAF5829749.1 cytochrome b-5, isoform CRA_e [Dunaliella salina]